VTAAEVQRQDVSIVLEGLGTVQALYTATIRSQVTGTLEKVDFTEGLKVKRGQVLAQIDPRTFQAALDQAIATRDRDQAQLDNAKENLGRYKPLLKQGYSPTIKRTPRVAPCVSRRFSPILRTSSGQVVAVLALVAVTGSLVDLDELAGGRHLAFRVLDPSRRECLPRLLGASHDCLTRYNG
jgi:multidrug efflux system membrane fusion protein